MRTAGAVVRLIIEHQDFPTDDEIAAIIDREMHQRELVEALEGIIAHCVHPDKAITAVMVDLSPIRTALKLAKEGA